MPLASRICFTALLAVLALPFAVDSASAQQRQTSSRWMSSTRGPAAAGHTIRYSHELTSAPLIQPPAIELAVDNQPSWWRRHPVWIGTLIGAAAGLGVFYLSSSRDEYCQDPDMVPCEAGIPFFVIGGGALGAGLVAAVRTLR
jgi:hypothetical protein